MRPAARGKSIGSLNQVRNLNRNMEPLIQLQPDDIYNQQLVDNVHPADWVNPTPAGRYNMVVIGAGTAGLVSAAGAAGLGAKVALIERGLMGGDCLNVGCVPSKAIVRASRVAVMVRDAQSFGINVPENWQADFPAVMERMRKLRAGISQHDSAARFRDLGVDVFLGSAIFTGPNTIEVAGQELKFKRAVIATGARAAELPIPGLRETGVLTNETVFSLTELPPRLTVIGAGPIGCEMAQAFARLGSKVTVIEMARQILGREDPEAAAIVRESLERDGVRFVLGAETKWFELRSGEKVTGCQRDGKQLEIFSDEILVSIGRTPNVTGMGLESAAVGFDLKKGIHVNDRMQTTNRSIYAAGDVASKFKFTHAADRMARIVIQNALFLGRKKAGSMVIPWCTYTSPELAHVGLTTEEADAQGIGIDTFTQPFSEVDRAVLDGTTEGFARVHVRQGTGRIVGATVVGENAGELISQFSLAMTHGLGLKHFASTVYPYPTATEAIRKLGDQYNKTRLSPWIKSMFQRWLAWTR